MKRLIPYTLALALALPTVAPAQNYLANNIAILKLCKKDGGADPAGCALLKIKRTEGFTYARHMFAELYKVGKRGYGDVSPQADQLYQRWAGWLKQGVAPNLVATNAGILLETALIRQLQTCQKQSQLPCPILQGEGRALLQSTVTFLYGADINYREDWQHILDIAAD